MPIFRKAKVGNHENVMVLRFGTADIAITEGFIEDSPHIATLHFTENLDKKMKVGQVEVLDNLSSDDLKDLPLMMEFDNVKSIDAIIGRLEKCKERLNENPS